MNTALTIKVIGEDLQSLANRYKEEEKHNIIATLEAHKARLKVLIKKVKQDKYREEIQQTRDASRKEFMEWLKTQE